MRAGSNGAFQLILWIPDPDPQCDLAHEAKVRVILSKCGSEVSAEDAEASLPDFAAQCDAMLAAGPHVISSIMGVHAPPFFARMKERGVRWFATVTTVTEVLAAQAAGADVIVAQGMEVDGHRGSFKADDAARSLVGLFSLLPAVVDAVDLPVVATGGIVDARGVAATLVPGASTVQVGAGLLRPPEAVIAPVWADVIAGALQEGTVSTRAFSGRLERSIRSDYTDAAETGPTPAPYPIQRNITKVMPAGATEIDRMQAWAGRSAGLTRAEPATDLVEGLWRGTRAMLPDD